MNDPPFIGRHRLQDDSFPISHGSLGHTFGDLVQGLAAAGPVRLDIHDDSLPTAHFFADHKPDDVLQGLQGLIPATN